MKTPAKWVARASALIAILLIGQSVSAFAEPEEPAGQKGAGEPAKAPAAGAERKILYYRNPMGLPDTSPTPKKDWMGMDYIPVYEGEVEEGASVKVSLDKVQKAGVRTEPARVAKLVRPVRAPGIVKPDERTLRTISLRADGFIEKLYANQHGARVKAGEPLFRIYSQEMLRALADYRLEAREPGGDPRRSILSARQKLVNLEVPAEAIEDARRDKELPSAFDWPSPVSGVIMEKKVVEGQMARMGEELFLIGDLSTVWVIADVPEHAIDTIKVGAPAKVSLHALPGETFIGKATFILHELDHGARTGKVRIEVPNPDYRIRHEMYADVEIDAGAEDKGALAVPASAVIDSGNRQVVLVVRGEGRFEPRDVKLGQRGEGLIEVREGVREGEEVVVSGNFLIDAEANLTSALSSFTAGSAASEGMGAGRDVGKPMEDAATGRSGDKPAGESKGSGSGSGSGAEQP
jgi:Cu(I)/Ag(I) efflux system membrane fusion protein